MTTDEAFVYEVYPLRWTLMCYYWALLTTMCPTNWCVLSLAAVLSDVDGILSLLIGGRTNVYIYSTIQTRGWLPIDDLIGSWEWFFGYILEGLATKEGMSIAVIDWDSLGMTSLIFREESFRFKAAAFSGGGGNGEGRADESFDESKCPCCKCCDMNKLISEKDVPHWYKCNGNSRLGNEL